MFTRCGDPFDELGLHLYIVIQVMPVTSQTAPDIADTRLAPRTIWMKMTEKSDGQMQEVHKVVT